MKLVIIGGSGLIGANIVNRLRLDGHEVVAASPSTGVNAFTGEGLDAALTGADVVVDVANSPSFEAAAVRDFFTTTSRNLLAAAARAGVRHYVALSVVGAERLPDNAYFRAKLAQERLVTASGLPYTLVRSTQFFEFVEGIVNAGVDGDTIRLSPALIQPIAADDVATALVHVALRAPLNAMLEVAGPERFPLDDLARKFLDSRRDTRRVIADIHARYFGSELNDRALVAGNGARLGVTRFRHWLGRPAVRT